MDERMSDEGVEKLESVEAASVEQPDVAAADAPVLEPGAGFVGFGLCEELMAGIREAGFCEPTPIQKAAIPEALKGRDLLGQALTGTGKTTAFGLPSMERIKDLEGLQMLVLTPTRELAAQISSELYRLGHFTGLKPAAFTGGQSYRRQEELLARGVNILVATPGRLIDLMESGHFEGVNPAVIVVDEADEMLDMGFIDDVKRIFQQFPGPHQTMLFSATMPKQVEALARDILHDPLMLETETPQGANNDIEQHYFIIEEYERTNAVVRLIESEEVTKAIIFCRTREETDSLNILLGGRGYNVNCLHGDMEQAARGRVMAAFRRGDFDILVATDVAARGIDVDNVSHVFNYHLPFDSRAYVHRIGRTGRAGKTGKAITLVTPRELRQLEGIRRSVGAKLSLGQIPTRDQVNSQRLERLLASLFAANLDVKLFGKIQEMIASQDQDPAVLFTKMVSRQLALTADQGPEHIGVSPEKLEKLTARAYRNRSRFAQRALFQEERGGEGGGEGGEGATRPPRKKKEGGSHKKGAEGVREDRGNEESFERPAKKRRYEDREFEHSKRRHEDYEGGENKFREQKRKKREKAEARGERPAAQKPVLLNPDGTPKLNRKQRRALKFGNPMPEK